MAANRSGIDVPDDNCPVHSVENRVEIFGFCVEGNKAGDNDIGSTSNADGNERMISLFENTDDDFEISGITYKLGKANEFGKTDETEKFETIINDGERR